MPWSPFIFGNPASLGQQTAVGQIIATGGGGGRMTGTRRRKKKRVAKVARRRRTTRAAPRSRKRRAGKARLVKGSAAAKRYMAKIRRKRR